MLHTLAVSGYRSLRDLVMPLERLNLVTGPNGSGKSNLYRALRLLAETAQGRVIPSLAREGGLQSTLWAGPETFSRAVFRGEHPVQGVVRKNPISLRLGFAGDDFSFAIDRHQHPGPAKPRRDRAAASSQRQQSKSTGRRIRLMVLLRQRLGW